MIQLDYDDGPRGERIWCADCGGAHFESELGEGIVYRNCGGRHHEAVCGACAQKRDEADGE
jgi:hypothetical protein